MIGVLLALALTSAEEAGRTLFVEGSDSVVARLGDGEFPSTVLPCASCHGADAAGRPEGGVVPPDISWWRLTRPYGHVHPNGRRHGAFDESAFARAVRLGIDPAGHRLDPSMPRYAFTDEQLDHLRAYLDTLGDGPSPGVEPERLRLVTVLPAHGPLAPMGARLRRVLEASLEARNREGGVYGRRLELVVASPAPKESATEALSRVLARTPAFAMLSGLAPGEEEALSALALQRALPMVGLVSPFAVEEPANRWVFQLEPGLHDLARVLVEHATRELAAEVKRAAILHPEGERAFEEAAHAAFAQAMRRGWPHPEVVAFRSSSMEQRVRALEARGTRLVVFVGADASLTAFLQAAESIGWHPWVLASGTVAARSALSASAPQRKKLRLVWPTLPDLASPAAAQAFAAANVLLEGLVRAGHRPTRDGLVEALERLSAFDAGAGAPLTFGPVRRIGARGGQVAAPAEGRVPFRPVGARLELVD